MEEAYVQIELDDERMKLVADCISNKSCNRLLKYFSEKEGTATDASRDLGLALNTTDYNVKKLLKAGLIEKSSHFWSVRGKKMPTYKISNKKIVISPRTRFNFLTAGVSVALAGFATLGVKIWESKKLISVMNAPFVDESFASVAYDGAGAMKESAPILASRAVESGASLGDWKWFAVGALSALIIYIFVDFIFGNRLNKIMRVERR